MKLVFLNGKKAGGEYELNPPGISIGRETDNDINFLEPGLSRYHAKVEWSSGQWLIKDLESKNGVKINGTRITEPHTLKDGDKIALGNQLMQFAETAQAKVEKSPNPVKPDGNTTSSSITQLPPEEPRLSSQKSITSMDETIKEQDKKEPKSLWDNLKGPSEKDGEKSGNVFDNFDLFGGGKAKKEEAKHEDSGEKKKKISNLLFYVAVIGAAVIFVSLFLILEQNGNSKKNRNAGGSRQKELPLYIYYVKEVTKPNNIFRFSIKIENDSALVMLDDIKHLRHLSKPVKNIPKEHLKILAQSIRNTKFMDLVQEPGGVSTDGTDEERTLIVSYGTKLNKINVKNTFAPSSFEEVEAALEEFSTEQLGINLSMTVEEMKAEAQKAFYKAEELYANYAAKPENLNEAIKRYKVTMDMLQHFTPKPENWDIARKKSQEAKAMLKKQIKDHDFNAQQAFRMQDLETARNEYAMIMKKKDPDSKEYRRARDKVIRIEKMINSRKKK